METPHSSKDSCNLNPTLANPDLKSGEARAGLQSPIGTEAYISKNILTYFIKRNY